MAPRSICYIAALLLSISATTTATPLENDFVLTEVALDTNAFPVPTNCKAWILRMGGVPAQNIEFWSPPKADDAVEITEYGRNCTSVHDPIDTDWSGPHEIVVPKIDISAFFCEPLKPNPDPNARRIVQLLVHGATHNKWAWHGLSRYQQYNWAYILAKEGYYTLAIDLFGHGNSSFIPGTKYTAKPQFPDPITDIQQPVHVEIIHNLVHMLRSKTRVKGFGFDKVVYVGHGLGAQIGIHFQRKYPEDCDAIVVTGYHDTGLRPAFEKWNFTPSALTGQDEYKDRPLGYLKGTNSSGRESIMFAHNYDPRLPQLDFELQDTLTIGEACWPGIMTPVPNWKKKVLWVAGEYDDQVCPYSGNKKAYQYCKKRLEDRCKRLFPHGECSVWLVQNSGHAWMLHREVTKAQQKGIKTVAKVDWPGFNL
ncbi:Alpha/Beta hydrolase protein [Podospora australis]|uniref:Alpha/Beta hydrolase protein n=1 Tax=Podospora australis TaxID=1536484 RepID=A0AAN7AH28_9PEZI|nr:Alpha/Beta hydrolase protein [Podospora australis]